MKSVLRTMLPAATMLALGGCGGKVAHLPISANQKQLVGEIGHTGATDLVPNGRPDGGMSLAGKLAGRSFGVAFPRNWNHQVVLFANGYSIPGTPVSVPPDPIAKEPSGGFLTAAYDQGFAVGQSAFDKPAMAVESGVANTLRLRGMFQDIGVDRFYLSGASMGGNIVMALIETHPHDFVGAMAACGVTGGWESQVGKMIDLRAAYNHFTAGTKYGLPGNPDIAANALSPDPPLGLGALRTPWVFWQIRRMSSPVAKLFKAARADPHGVEAKMVAKIASVAQVDPDPAEFMYPIMTAMLGMDDMRASFGGLAFGNRGKVYHSDLLTPAENSALNRGIQRIDADPKAVAFADRWYRSTGRFDIPLVAVHNRQDGLVFADQAKILAGRVDAAGNRSHFFQLWAPSMVKDIPGTGLAGYAHCGFTPRQARSLWALLHGWVESGAKPKPGLY